MMAVAVALAAAASAAAAAAVDDDDDDDGGGACNGNNGETETSTSSAGSVQLRKPCRKVRFFSTLALGRITLPPERSERVSLLETSVVEVGRFGGWPPPEARGG